MADEDERKGGSSTDVSSPIMADEDERKGGSSTDGEAAFVERVRASRHACRAGRLYMWGLALGGLPLPGTAVDSAGDCAFPARVVIPKVRESPREPRFVRVAADLTVFAALDEAGRVWAWGKERSGLPTQPTPFALPRVDDAVAVDCSVGASFVVAASASGRAYALGKLPFAARSSRGAPRSKGIVGGKASCSEWVEMRRCTSERGGSTEADSAANDMADPIVQVEACGDTVVATTLSGKVWSAGSALTNGLGRQQNRMTSLAHVSAFGATRILTVALGSLHAAAIDEHGVVWVWGDGLSGQLGVGKRCRLVATPTPLPLSSHGGVRAVEVGCTRGQPSPRRQGTKPGKMRPGQEGPRMHVVVEDGRLFVAGATHKGLGGDHLSKTFTPDHDLLTLYHVGGPAADVAVAKHGGKVPIPCPTGGAEELALGNTDVAEWSLGLPATDPPCAGLGSGGRTNYLSGVRIIASQPSHIHSLALSDDGRVFTWGCGTNGRTGLAAFLRGPGGSKRRLKCYVSSPTAVESLRGMAVVFATSGKYWTLAIIQDRAADRADRADRVAEASVRGKTSTQK